MNPILEFLLDLVYDWDNIPSYEHFVLDEKPEDDILDIIEDSLPDPEEFLMEVCLHPDAIMDADTGRIALEDKRMDDAANIMLDLAASYPVWGGRTIFGVLVKVVK